MLQTEALWSLWLFPPAGFRSRLRTYKAEEAPGSWLCPGQQNKGFCGTTSHGEVELMARRGCWVSCCKSRANENRESFRGNGSS